MIKIKHPNFDDREIEIESVESEVVVNAIVSATDGKIYRIPIGTPPTNNEEVELFVKNELEKFKIV